VEIYMRLTGNSPTASARLSKKDNRGNISGGYGGFLEAFMAAIQDEKPPTGDEVRGFLRSRFGERTKKFRDARHVSPRQLQSEKPLKRS